MNGSPMLLSVALLFLAATVGQAVDDEFNEPIDVLDDDGTKVGQVPAQRDPLPFDGNRGDARLGVTRAGHVYAAMGDTLCWTEDGGNSWQSRKLRDELLNVEIFDMLLEAQVLVERWRTHYNTVRLHSALNYRPAAPEAVPPWPPASATP